MVKVGERTDFSLVPVSLSFRHAWISLPISGSWELLHILIYFIIFNFIFLLFKLPHIHNLAFHGCLYQGHESDELHWTMRCQNYLILLECYWIDLPPWLEAQLQNLQFLAYLTLPDCRGSCSPSEISSTVWLLYCTAPFNFCTRIVFGCFHSVMAQFELIKHKFLDDYTTCSSVQLSNHTESEPQFKAYLTLPDGWDSYDSSKIS